jgi:hypothetical protein
VAGHGQEPRIYIALLASAHAIHRRLRVHCPRTMYGWLPRGKSVSVEAGVISVAAMYTASDLQHGSCAP